MTDLKLYTRMCSACTTTLTLTLYIYTEDKVRIAKKNKFTLLGMDRSVGQVVWR